MMVLMAMTATHLLRRSNAAVKNFAAHVLELDGAMADAEMVPQYMVELNQDAGAF
jgi:hypothetical protein